MHIVAAPFLESSSIDLIVHSRAGCEGLIQQVCYNVSMSIHRYEKNNSGNEVQMKENASGDGQLTKGMERLQGIAHFIAISKDAGPVEDDAVLELVLRNVLASNNSSYSAVEATLGLILLWKCEYVAILQSCLFHLAHVSASLKMLQSTITGVVILHLLLIPGFAFLTGGARIWEQNLRPHATQLNHSLLTIG
jgi:hypothetical protein